MHPHSRSCVVRMIMVVGVMLAAPTVGWGAACDEAQQWYTRGVTVSLTGTSQGPRCTPECLEKKRALYQRAVDLCEAYPEAHINLADALEKLGRYPEALVHYSRAVQLAPNFAIAHFTLGDYYLHTKDYTEAVAAYTKGLEIDPTDTRAQERLHHALCLKDTDVPSAACIEEVLGGRQIIDIMGPSGTREDPRLPMLIPFAFNKDTLLPEAQRPLHELGTALKAILAGVPSAAFVVEGHTDQQGSDAYNFDLSTRRAQRVREALITDFALPADKFQVEGYGKTRPLSDGTSEVDHARNRRVEIVRVQNATANLEPQVKPTNVSTVTSAASLRVEVGLFYEDAESRPQKLHDGATLRSGDGYRVVFEPQQPCYVYIFQIDSSGQLFHLFPNREYGSMDNAVQAHTTYWAPGKQQWFELNHTRGKEEIYVVASKEQREDLKDVFARLARGASTETQQDGQQTLTVVIKNMGVAGIREGRTVDIASRNGGIVPMTLDQLQQEGRSFVYKVAFQHK